jgi:hypothetical protein
MVRPLIEQPPKIQGQDAGGSPYLDRQTFQSEIAALRQSAQQLHRETQVTLQLMQHPAASPSADSRSRLTQLEHLSATASLMRQRAERWLSSIQTAK